MSDELPIQMLVASRCEVLNLRPTELIRRCGYKNVPKGLRRLQQICRGDFGGSATLIRGLPFALGLPTEAVTRAVEDTQRQLREAEDAASRAAFEPHAIILTERKIPQPIFAAALIGVDRLRRVEFDPKPGPVSYIKQALDGVRQKLARWNSEQIPTFGRPTDIIVNYTRDHAVHFDLSGKTVATLDRAYRIGDATLSIGKRPLSSRELEAIFSAHRRNR